MTYFLLQNPTMDLLFGSNIYQLGRWCLWNQSLKKSLFYARQMWVTIIKPQFTACGKWIIAKIIASTWLISGIVWMTRFKWNNWYGYRQVVSWCYHKFQWNAASDVSEYKISLTSPIPRRFAHQGAIWCVQKIYRIKKTIRVISYPLEFEL